MKRIYTDFWFKRIKGKAEQIRFKSRICDNPFNPLNPRTQTNPRTITIRVVFLR